MDKTYVVGVDFGTESCRALVVNTKNGEEMGTACHTYQHGVLDKELPNGERLEPDWALQHPRDYLEGLKASVTGVLKKSNIAPDQVIGIGIDFTSCTMLPLDANGEPLCLDPYFSNRPHSWTKLWKHHAAQKEANEITQLALVRDEKFIRRYGGRISSEWILPKILQVLKEDPDLYEKTDLFLEAGDWLVYKMTGNLIRSSNTSGYKAFWSKKDGYPNKAFLEEIHPKLKDIYETKLRGEVKSIGTEAGNLTDEMASYIGLNAGTSVAVNVIDAHAAVPAVGAVHPGQFVMAIGTSTCQMLNVEEEEFVEGVCGVVEDGIIPGYVSYETGQTAVGDSFAWFVENLVSSEVEYEAKKSKMSIHAYLEEKAAKLDPGQSGLVALDWWNGNRTTLVDANLSGIIIGLTLSTTPEEIYRALIESTAFGTRKIIDNFKKSNINVSEIFVCGGIPQKNKMLLQIYADVLNCEIKVADSAEITALGSAIYAAVAAGKTKGGYDSLIKAAEVMSKVKKETIVPNLNNVEKYNKLYNIYTTLYYFFGIEEKEVLHDLKLKNE